MIIPTLMLEGLMLLLLLQEPDGQEDSQVYNSTK
jgi:hypothetical protein